MSRKAIRQKTIRLKTNDRTLGRLTGMYLICGFRDSKGVVVGLRAKGRARGDCSGFVVGVEKLEQISL